MAKSNFETQQHRFLASSANTSLMQPTKPFCASTGSFRKPKPPAKSLRPKIYQPYKPRTQSKSFAPFEIIAVPVRRASNSQQFPSSKPAYSSTKFLKPSLSTACISSSKYTSGMKIGLLCGTLGRNKSKGMGPSYRPKILRSRFAPLPHYQQFL